MIALREFDNYVNLLIKTNCIDITERRSGTISGFTRILSTLEFRMCDIPMRVDETICLAALMQAVVVKLYAS